MPNVPYIPNVQDIPNIPDNPAAGFPPSSLYSRARKLTIGAYIAPKDDPIVWFVVFLFGCAFACFWAELIRD